MKKIIFKKIVSIFTFIFVGSTTFAQTIIYSEDFRPSRGYEKEIIDNQGQADGNIFKGDGNVPDAGDSNGLFIPATDRPTVRIPNGTARGQWSLAVDGHSGSNNYAIDAYAIFTTLDLTSANALINPSDTYKYASFWSQVSYAWNDPASIEMRVSTDYGTAGHLTAATATWTTLSLHSGKYGNSTNDDQKFVKGMVDLTAFANGANGSTVTLALHYQGGPTGPTGPDRNGIFRISDLQFIAQSTPITNVWTGNTDSDLTEPANWDTKAAPVTITNNLVIPGGLTNYPTSIAALTVNNLTLESGSSFITNSIVTGNITYKRTLTADASPLKAWHLVSSPVTGQTVQNFIANNTLATGTSNTSFRGIANYKIGGAGWNYYLNTYSDADAFDAGKGYSVKAATAGDVSFTGTFTSGNKEYNINQTTNNYNLVGNPFAAHVNLGTFFTDNNATDRLEENTIYIWNQSANGGNGEYTPKTSGDDAAFEIAPGQGFFVVSGTAASNKVTFNEANQSHKTTDAFLKTAPRPEIHLKVYQIGLEHQTKIYFVDGSTTGFDNGYDASLFGGVSYDLAVYSELINNNQGKKLGIQSLPNNNFESMVVPVGLKAEAGKEITFSTEALNLPSDLKVFLEDRATNTFTRLDETNSNYKVTLAEDLYGIGRFYLHTKSSVLNTDNFLLDNISIYKTDNSNLRIAGLQPGSVSVKLFNILGKQMMSSAFKSNGVQNISLPNLATGIYIVQLETESGTLNKKIILE